MAIWKVRVPVLCEAPQGKNEGFDLAGGTASGCFDCCFVFEEKFSWVGVSVILRENVRVEMWRPLELFELYQKKGAKASLLWLMLLLYYCILAFFFVGVQLFFDNDRFMAKP